MKAQAIHDAILITAVYPDWDGQGGVLETTCSDYDHYVRLPAVVSYNGVRYGKTGWSSDRNYACYKSGMLIADKVR